MVLELKSQNLSANHAKGVSRPSSTLFLVFSGLWIKLATEALNCFSS